jgi:prevent-host-death family protein
MDDQLRPPAKPITAMKARQQLGTILEEVYYRGEIYIVERAGKPMAAVIPVWLLEELQEHRGRTKTDTDTIKKSKRRANKRRA